MGIKCAEDPFNMGMFFDIRHPSLWLHFQTKDTHIRAFHTGVAPQGSNRVFSRPAALVVVNQCGDSQTNKPAKRDDKV